ncbi:MAG: repair protein RecN [Verrucomicrobiota bacterium]|jgi:DNA repair protein RecN (Recombination protein N)
MLRRLRIKNLAVVEEVEWELGAGFNVLTGETGAGKSILIDAFLLLLGERADKSLVRTGAEGCLVEGELGGADAYRSWLEEKGVEADPEGMLVIKRQISATGTGRQFLNGSAVTLGVLKELGDRLVDLHGPHDHQTLLSPVTQRSALDRFGGLEKEVEAVRLAWRQKREAEEKLEQFRRRMAGADGATKELIDHQVRELEQARLRPGEDEELERDHAAAGHGKRIVELAAEVNGLLESGEENALGFLGKVQKALAEWERLDGAAAEMRSRNEQAVETLRDLAREAEQRAEQVGLDAERLAEMEKRLDVVLGLKKKYGGSVESALGRLGELQKRQQELADAGGTEKALGREVEGAAKRHMQACGKVAEGRKKVAPRFAKEVTEQLRGLGFAQSRLEVEIKPQESGPDGSESVELLFAPNPGESPRPLRGIASSGEMARVMLGLKTVLAERDAVPILIFDEVDANVGGETAVAVAARLRGLGKSHQVLCLTHLPAVAAAADNHFAVAKRVDKGRTFAELEKLEGEKREKELTRMLGGEGKAARMLAKEMLGKGVKR